MSQLQVTGEAKIRDIQGPVVANSGVVTALDGAASQYVRGDGTLADFPTSSGGGSSVSYYLNSSVSQGTIGGVAYRELSKDPIIGGGTDIAISSNGYVANYITDVNDPDVTIVPGGNFNCEFYFSVNNNTGNPFTYAELYKYDGTTFTLLGTSAGVPESINQGTIIAPYYFAIPVATATLALTDRLAIRIYVNVDSRTVTLHTENGHLCQVVTTLSKGMVSLNNLTDQSQFLTTGTAGTNFAIASTGDTHTFNLPVASATNTGKLSSTDWSTFNNKQNTITDPITGTGASTQIAYFNSGTSITSEAAFNYDASTNRLGVNTSVPNATIGANAATDSGYSLLLKNDNANYNGIGFATDSTYGNLISTEKQGTALTRNLTLLNQSGFISLTEAGNLGVGLLTPNTGLDIYNGTSSYLWLHTANSGITGTDGVRLALFSTNTANLRNFEGAMSITSEGDFSVITLGAENLRVNSADGSIYQSKVANAMLKSVSGVITAAVANTDYQSPISLTTSGSSGAATFSSNTLNVPNYTLSGLGGVPTSRTLSINGVSYDLSADRSWTITSDITGSGADGRVAYWNGTNSLTSEAGFIYDASTNRLGVNTSVPNATIGADAALNSGYGLLIKTGASNYNGIGIAIDSTYGNTIETAKLGTASARNLTLLNQSGFVSLTESGAFGVGILTPNNGIDIYNSTQSQLWLHNNASGLTSTDGVRLALFNNLSANLRNFDGALSLTAEGDFQIITIGAENIRVNSANGFVGIGNPATLTSLLTVNGSITQSVTSALLKTNASGTIVAAVAGTDYVIPSALSSYVPTSRTITINGTAFDLSADRSYSVGTVTSVGLSSATSGVTIGSSPITTSGTITLAIATASGSQNGLLSSTDWTTFNNKASTAALANYLPLTGGTLTGALGGTSASFSSTLTAGDTTIINVAPILAIQSNTTGNIFLRFRQSADTMASMFYTNSTATFTMSNNMGGLRFNTSGTSDALNISSTGSATFDTTSSASAIFNSTNASGGFIAFRRSGTNIGYLGNSAQLGIGTLNALELRADNDLFLTTTSGVLAITNGGNIQVRNGNILNIYRTDNTRALQLYTTTNECVIDSWQSSAEPLHIRSMGSGGRIQFFTSGSEAMRITSGGAILANLTTPIYDGAGAINTKVTATSVFMFSGEQTNNSNPRGIFLNHSVTTGDFAIYYKAAGAEKFYVNGNGAIYSTSAVITLITSDVKLKTDIKDYDKGLSEILAMKPRYFKYKNNLDVQETGFIAQEMEEALAGSMIDVPSGLDTGEFHKSYKIDWYPLLVKAIQEQQAQIEELKELIKNK